MSDQVFQTGLKAFVSYIMGNYIVRFYGTAKYTECG